MDLDILWLNRQEELIQDAMEDAFRNDNYKVTNYHKIDRSHEKGIDLECKKPDEKIVVQIKIKPDNDDIRQLGLLSKTKADKRVFAYVKEPTVAFQKEQSKIKNVEYWNKEKLHDFLLNYKSTIYYRLLFLATPVVHDIIDILEIIDSCYAAEPVELKNIHETSKWLIFKDRAVKLHSSMELVYEWYKADLLSKDRIDDSEINYYMKNIFMLFEKISELSSRDLVDTVKEVKEKYPQLLSEFIVVVSKASNWIGMHFGVKENQRERIEKWIIPIKNRENTFYNIANFYLSKLKDTTEAIEDGVDWVFEASKYEDIAHK